MLSHKKISTAARLLLFLCLGAFLACGQESEETEDAWADLDEPAQTTETSPQQEETSPEPTPAPVIAKPNPVFTTQPRETGWVKAICLNVRRGPGSGNPVDGYLFKGDKLDILSKQGSWLRVNDENGYVDGWVSAAWISRTPIQRELAPIPLEKYKRPLTPTVIENLSAKYVGVQACVSCHSKPHAGFAMGPYGVWRDHFHANALKSLRRPYAIAIARQRGVNDPANDWKCRKCHVTAYGVPTGRLGPNYTDEDGVGCETCHGPGSEYLKPHVDQNADEAQLAAMGFRVYTDINEREQVCRACHNELSPTYKPFNVVTFSNAIRHWGYEDVVQVGEPDEPPVIKQVAVQAPPQPPPTETVKTVTAPPPPPSQKSAPPPPPSSGGSRSLSGIADTWLLDKVGQRGPTNFPHKKHATEFVSARGGTDACQVCHHTSKAGQRPTTCSGSGCHQFEPTAQAPNRKDAFHDNCKGCHLDEGTGPTKCSECHDKSLL